MKVAGETWQRSQRTSPAAGSYTQPCASIQAMRSTGYTSPFKQDALLWLVKFSAAVIGVFRSFQFFWCVVPLVVHCHAVLLLFCFLIMSIYASGISIPPDIARVKSYVNHLFDPVYVPMRISWSRMDAHNQETQLQQDNWTTADHQGNNIQKQWESNHRGASCLKGDRKLVNHITW